jgi:hypothetical protein
MKKNICIRSIICASSIASAKAVAPRIVPCSSKWGKKERDLK